MLASAAIKELEELIELYGDQPVGGYDPIYNCFRQLFGIGPRTSEGFSLEPFTDVFFCTNYNLDPAPWLKAMGSEVAVPGCILPVQKNGPCNRVLVEWVNASDSFKEETEVVEDIVGLRPHDVIEHTIPAFGCTSRESARRVGKIYLKLNAPEDNKEEL